MSSFKKSLGSIGCGVVWSISIFSIVMNPNDAGILTLIIVENIALIISLFGIKAYAGIKAKSIDSKRNEVHE